MSYVEKSLMRGEELLYKAKIHWFVYVPGAVSLLVAIVFISLAKGPSYLNVIPPVAILFGIYSLVMALIQTFTTELAVTTKRVIAKAGLIRRSTMELNHGKVESFNVDQSILGRIFGFGTVVVNGTGGGQTPIPSIAAPLDFRREAMEAIDGAQAHTAN